jgi:hypothetical protein
VSRFADENRDKETIALGYNSIRHRSLWRDIDLSSDIDGFDISLGSVIGLGSDVDVVSGG